MKRRDLLLILPIILVCAGFPAAVRLEITRSHTDITSWTNSGLLIGGGLLGAACHLWHRYEQRLHIDWRVLAIALPGLLPLVALAFGLVMFVLNVHERATSLALLLMQIASFSPIPLFGWLIISDRWQNPAQRLRQVVARF